MGEEKNRLLLAGAAIAMMMLAVGCGGSSLSSSDGSSSTTGNPSGATSAEFLRPNSPSNKYVRFGSEAPAAEREAASEVLKENLEAREDADFATQCASLSKAAVEEIATPKKGAAAAATCADALKTLAEPLKGTKEARTDTFAGQIAVLRIKGANAYALYHGNDKKDYEMPMENEDGDWKVGSLLTTELG